MGDFFVLIDRTQPVVSLIRPDGDLVAVGSWKELVRHPHEWTAWPTRRLYQSGSRLWLIESNAAATVQIAVGRNGEIDCSVAEKDDAAVAIGQSRHSWSYQFEIGNRKVWIESVLCRDWSWDVLISVMDDSAGSARVISGGSITGAAHLDGILAVCVRRATKRPWIFEPEHVCYLIDLSKDDLSTVPAIDMGDRRWSAAREVDLLRVVSQYVGYSFAEAEILRELGAWNVEVAVRCLDTVPRVVTSFSYGATGRHFVRRDHPFNEDGLFTGGLRNRGILIEEDVLAGLLDGGPVGSVLEPRAI